MKQKNDPRHRRRIEIMQQLFAYNFQQQSQCLPKTKKIIALKKEISAVIAKAAPAWPLEKIAKIDLAILELAVYELLYKITAPRKVVIDEAIELAKEFGNDGSPGFINGALGSLKL